MAYRGSFGRPATRLAATAGAIVPASIISGLIGTACLTALFMAGALLRGDFFPPSLEGLISALAFTGVMIAFGTFAGAFVVAWYLVVFGLPVALLLGERIRTPGGLIAAMATAAVAALAAIRLMWGFTALLDEPFWQEEALMIFAFVLPAAWFYRRQVIAMLDEMPAA